MTVLGSAASSEGAKTEGAFLRFYYCTSQKSFFLCCMRKRRHQKRVTCRARNSPVVQMICFVRDDGTILTDLVLSGFLFPVDAGVSLAG